MYFAGDVKKSDSLLNIQSGKQILGVTIRRWTPWRSLIIPTAEGMDFNPTSWAYKQRLYLTCLPNDRLLMETDLDVGALSYG
jgi:hypothetical protein